jgi:hypothetical protein
LPSTEALTIGWRLQRVGGGLGEEAHEAELDAVGLLELLAQLLAHRHHLARG